MTKTSYAQLILLSSLLLANGCAQRSTSLQVEHRSSPTGSLPAQTTAPTTDTKTVGPPQSFNGLEITTTRGKDIGGLYQASILISNLKSTTQNLQYQVIWVDADGNALPHATTPWAPFIIYGKSQKTITAVSPDPAARHFQISLRTLKANKTFKTNVLGIE
jgi:uncharacterized protein YcfL